MKQIEEAHSKLEHAANACFGNIVIERSATEELAKYMGMYMEVITVTREGESSEPKETLGKDFIAFAGKQFYEHQVSKWFMLLKTHEYEKELKRQLAMAKKQERLNKQHEILKPSLSLFITITAAAMITSLATGLLAGKPLGGTVGWIVGGAIVLIGTTAGFFAALQKQASDKQPPPLSENEQTAQHRY